MRSPRPRTSSWASSAARSRSLLIGTRHLPAPHLGGIGVNDGAADRARGVVDEPARQLSDHPVDPVVTQGRERLPNLDRGLPSLQMLLREPRQLALARVAQRGGGERLLGFSAACSAAGSSSPACRAAAMRERSAACSCGACSTSGASSATRLRAASMARCGGLLLVQRLPPPNARARRHRSAGPESRGPPAAAARSFAAEASADFSRKRRYRRCSTALRLVDEFAAPGVLAQRRLHLHRSPRGFDLGLDAADLSRRRAPPRSVVRSRRSCAADGGPDHASPPAPPAPAPGRPRRRSGNLGRRESPRARL